MDQKLAYWDPIVKKHRAPPPYSPDLNPIEQAWSKIKQILRSLKARTLDALETAVAQALKAIASDNALAWFSHCGYGLQLRWKTL